MVWPPCFRAFVAILLSLLLPSVARDPTIPFCPNGMARPNFTNGAIVEVIYAQAPLFSLNPKIGQKLRMMNLYHSSVILSQGAGSNRHYWTLEFGFVAPSPLATLAPRLVANESAPGGTSLVWYNDAKYCLTYGLLHGRKYWTTHLDVVMSVSVDQANRAFDDFVAPLNRSSKPQYHTFKVVRGGMFVGITHSAHTVIDDMTCNHGALWFIHYLHTLGNWMPPDFKFKGTVAVIRASEVKLVDASGPQWNDVVNYYRKLGELVSSSTSHMQKLVDVVELATEHRYAYDPSCGQYFELIGNYFPWVDFQYDVLPLKGPPWSDTSSEISCAYKTSLAKPATVIV